MHLQYSLSKKSVNKWTCAVQTIVVQGSTVFENLLKQDSYFYKINRYHARERHNMGLVLGFTFWKMCS